MPSIKCICSSSHPEPPQLGTADRPHPSIAFVYKKGTRRFGSVQVRSRELATILEEYDPSLDVDSIPLENFRGGVDIVIASKTITKSRGVVGFLRKAKRSGTRVLFDLVDGNPRSTRKIDSSIWGFVCASHSELAYRQSLGQKAFLVPHNVDRRMKSPDKSASTFRIGYSGAPYNAEHLENLNIEVFDSSTTQSGSSFDELDEFLSSISHHYSVRRNENRTVFKPGLKTYISALYNRAFIGSHDDPETLSILGPDYPYLAKSSSIDDVRRMTEFAKETFRTTTHQEALDQLRSLRTEFCPYSVAAALHKTIQLALSS